MTTPSKFVAATLNQVTEWMASGNLKVNARYLNNEDTYIVICSPDQVDHKKALMKSSEINVLFVSKPAINRSPNHGTAPRNTVIVFEKK